MAFDFSTLVTDRTQQDVAYARQLVEKLVTGTATEAEIAEWNSFTLKGVYNHTDLNRVTAAMDALKAKLEGYGYAVPGYQRIVVPHVIPESKPTSKLPEGYQELTYIESTGSQYINSNYTPVGTTTMKATVLQYAANANVEQAVFGHSNSGFEMGFGDTNQVFLYSTASASYKSPNTVYDVVFDMTGIVSETSPYKKLILSLDGGVEATSTAANNSKWKDGVITLFALKEKYNFTGRLYCASIYDNSTLVRDFIPCINPDGAIGLYDLVTAAFFGNSGTGSFVAGAIPRKLPDGYTQVEYIQSTGTQYIDTGFKPNQDTRVVFDFQLLATSSNYRSVLGVRDTASDTSPRQFVFWNYPSDIFRTDYFGTNVTISGLTRLARMVLDKNKNVTTAQGLTTTNTAATGQCTQNLFLLCVNEAGTAKYFTDARIYACQIYDNGVLVRDYVPCINPSGVVGLYDMVNGVFYQNAGSGEFTAGYEVASPVTAAVAVVSNDLTEYDPYTWYEFDWPTPQTMTIYLLNVSAIRSVLELLPTTPKTPADMELLTRAEANDIEQILFDVDTVIYQVVNGFPRSDAFTFWSGNKPLPSATSDKGRTWEEQDAMNTTWYNWQVADWYLLLYGNLKAEGVIE